LNPTQEAWLTVVACGVQFLTFLIAGQPIFFCHASVAVFFAVAYRLTLIGSCCWSLVE
jgi:hypothetical protein